MFTVSDGATDGGWTATGSVCKHLPGSGTGFPGVSTTCVPGAGAVANASSRAAPRWRPVFRCISLIPCFRQEADAHHHRPRPAVMPPADPQTMTSIHEIRLPA